MKAKVSWVDGMRFMGTSGTGHSVVMDAKFEDRAPSAASPMEHVLLALGGCSSIDVVEILRKKRQPFTGVEVELDADRRAEPPRVFTKVKLMFVVRGTGVSEAAVKQAVDLSMEKYCSVAATLKAGGVEVAYGSRVEGDGEGFDAPGAQKPVMPGSLEVPRPAPHPEADLPFPSRPGHEGRREGADGGS
ncbi:MAG TPA: OsmC family protein [Candidatus Thermoplasmatota archaeon]